MCSDGGEAASVDHAEEFNVSDHAFFEASGTGGQPRIGGCAPFVHGVSGGVERRLEHTGVCEHYHSGHVAEAQ